MGVKSGKGNRHLCYLTFYNQKRHCIQRLFIKTNHCYAFIGNCIEKVGLVGLVGLVGRENGRVNILQRIAEQKIILRSGCYGERMKSNKITEDTVNSQITIGKCKIKTPANFRNIKLVKTTIQQTCTFNRTSYYCNGR